MAQLLIKRIYFPRGPFVQDGWIGANVQGAAFDAALYPPNVQLGGSFGVAKRRANIFPLLSQPDNGWMNFAATPPAAKRRLLLIGVGK